MALSYRIACCYWLYYCPESWLSISFVNNCNFMLCGRYWYPRNDSFYTGCWSLHAGSSLSYHCKVKVILEGWLWAEEDTAWESKLQLISIICHCCLRLVLHTGVWKSWSLCVDRVQNDLIQALLKLRIADERSVVPSQMYQFLPFYYSSASYAPEIHCWPLDDKKQLWVFRLLLFGHRGPHGNKHWLLSS